MEKTSNMATIATHLNQPQARRKMQALKPAPSAASNSRPKMSGIAPARANAGFKNSPRLWYVRELMTEKALWKGAFVQPSSCVAETDLVKTDLERFAFYSKFLNDTRRSGYRDYFLIRRLYFLRCRWILAQQQRFASCLHDQHCPSNCRLPIE